MNELKTVVCTVLCLLISIFDAKGQSEIQVFAQDTSEFTSEKILGNLVVAGLEIYDLETNFSIENRCFGYFNDAERYMGLEQGMILSTGTVDNVTKANSQTNYTSFVITAIDSLELLQFNETGEGELENELYKLYVESLKTGDDDLSAEIGGLVTYDARVIEFEFIPTADTLYYRYIFASEEYDEYVCSPYNDVFAFYLSEEGDEGQKQNIALVPGENLPVSINTVNNGNSSDVFGECKPSNAYLYKANDGTQNLLYDGFTRVLDIRQKVTPGKRYRLKIAIADASDGALDSAVLLENGSLFSYFNSFEIFFDQNSSEPNNYSELDEVLTSLEEHPESKILLTGHSDSDGSENYNFKLSIDRVTSVKQFLIDHMIDEDRIIEAYKGEYMPQSESKDENRRVEIFVMGE